MPTRRSPLAERRLIDEATIAARFNGTADPANGGLGDARYSRRRRCSIPAATTNPHDHEPDHRFPRPRTPPINGEDSSRKVGTNAALGDNALVGSDAVLADGSYVKQMVIGMLLGSRSRW
jgi:hypothetical protein